MNHIFAKVKMRGKGIKERKILSTDLPVYEMESGIASNSVEYDPDTLLDENSWYRISNLTGRDFCVDILRADISSIDFDLLSTELFTQIDYIFVDIGDYVFFQNISKSKLVRRKAILHLGENFKFDDSCLSISINERPDAIYDRKTDILYFKRLASITSIFKGIDQLYREATEGEVQKFLESEFICLTDKFDSKMVKTSNRHRIALAMDTLDRLDEYEKKQVFSYIKEYCPDLSTEEETFSIGSEDALKQLLYGIEQRYYTTLVGGEKRLANSVIKIG